MVRQRSLAGICAASLLLVTPTAAPSASNAAMTPLNDHFQPPRCVTTIAQK
jgi:hypothetical protein